MFPEDMKKVMSHKFTLLLADIVASVDDPKCLVSKLNLLGPMHVKRGVTVEMMGPMGEALLWTIEKVLPQLPEGGGQPETLQTRGLRSCCVLLASWRVPRTERRNLLLGGSEPAVFCWPLGARPQPGVEARGCALLRGADLVSSRTGHR